MANEGLGWDSLLKVVLILVLTIASWVGGRPKGCVCSGQKNHGCLAFPFSKFMLLNPPSHASGDSAGCAKTSSLSTSYVDVATTFRKLCQKKLGFLFKWKAKVAWNHQNARFFLEEMQKENWESGQVVVVSLWMAA